MNKLLVLAFFSFFLLSGCGEKKDHEVNYNMENEGPVTSDTTNADNNIVREGVIDLAAIDKNNDANVYQCPMDWNVLGDHAGSCPVCKMELEQYSIAEAKENLVKNDYKVK